MHLTAKSGLVRPASKQPYICCKKISSPEPTPHKMKKVIFNFLITSHTTCCQRNTKYLTPHATHIHLVIISRNGNRRKRRRNMAADETGSNRVLHKIAIITNLSLKCSQQSVHKQTRPWTAREWLEEADLWFKWLRELLTRIAVAM